MSSACLGGLPSHPGYKLAGDLPGGRVQAVERVDRRDHDHECSKLRVAVVARRLIPDLVRYPVRTVGDTGGGPRWRSQRPLGHRTALGRLDANYVLSLRKGVFSTGVIQPSIFAANDPL
jgi:hypothetical protein